MPWKAAAAQKPHLTLRQRIGSWGGGGTLFPQTPAFQGSGALCEWRVDGSITPWPPKVNAKSMPIKSQGLGAYFCWCGGVFAETPVAGSIYFTCSGTLTSGLSIPRNWGLPSEKFGAEFLSLVWDPPPIPEPLVESGSLKASWGGGDDPQLSTSQH